MVKASATPMLEIKDLHVYYGRAHVLQGVSLTLDHGVLAVVGRNGMGKTTLCNAIMGLVPARGSIKVAGREIVGLPPNEIVRLGLGYVPQGRRVWPSLSVDEHLRLAVAGGRKGPWTIDGIYDVFPRLAERKSNGGGQLSGGEQQMLAIGRALLAQPRILVMDEPTEGLAPVIVEQVADTLKALAGDTETSVFLVEQNLGVATDVSDDVAVMVGGRIARTMRAATLAADPDLQHRLLGVKSSDGDDFDDIPEESEPAESENTRYEAETAEAEAVADVPAEAKPAIGLTMFGVTTPCVQMVAEALGSRFDALIFHATGTGGQSMEKLIDSGLLVGVVDATTTEIADLHAGGIFSAGDDRLGAIIRSGLPYVGSCGALDMVNFGAKDTVPEKYKDRNLYVHNPQVTLMRTTPDENEAMGHWIAERLNRMTGPVRFLLPMGGVSMIDAPGKPFHDPEADRRLFDAIERDFAPGPNRKLIKLQNNINDPKFADALVECFLDVIGDAAN